MRNKFLLILSISCLSVVYAQTPSEFLGYMHGTYFSRHHQVVDYFETIATGSQGKMLVESYGSTNENRDLILAYISTPDNISRIDEIRKAHEEGLEEDVAIVWLSYNVHGNESSATEAAMITAYDLVHRNQDRLKNLLVIIDPCLNPDGRDRYVNWYNQKKNLEINTNPNTAEHDEPWPGGRVNHYMFDLNRDWAWITQVESRARMEVYHKWMPHVHVDFHEQGVDEPYYFAPAAEPLHESITGWQKEFQFGLGKNHAAYFDKKGWFYFTRENFDLLYPSYGDTYPTFTGAIGMTYEQGGSGRAGVGITNSEGDVLTLTDRINHHHATGLSTVEYSAQNYDKLISEYQAFVKRDDFKYKSYVIGGNDMNLRALQNLLDQHGIEYAFGTESKVSGYVYSEGKDGNGVATSNHLVVSTNQKLGTLVNVLFEPQTKLSTPETYDITAWSLPYVYGLSCIASKSLVPSAQRNIEIKHNAVAKKDYAYLIEWNSMSSAKALTKLINKGVRVRYAEEPFSVGGADYGAGTLIVVEKENEEFNPSQLIHEICSSMNLKYSSTSTGMVDKGKDFGSSTVIMIDSPRVGVIGGEGFSSNRFGEIWHYFEKELEYPIHVFNANNLDEDMLQDIDVLIVPSSWTTLPTAEITEWVRNGGKVIAVAGGVRNFNSDNGFELEAKEGAAEEDDEEKGKHVHISYADQDNQSSNDEINGAIYKCKVDNTNPLAFGYSEEYFTLKRSARAYSWLPDGDNVVYLEEDARELAGFVGKDVKDSQGESLIFGVEYMGGGSIVYMIDNPLFRAFWENGKLFMANAVFFGN